MSAEAEVGFDLNDAIKAHGAWKMRLREAISKREAPDVLQVSADNRCPLGVWLHGEGKRKYGRTQTFQDCVARHAAFHRAAGAVAAKIARGDLSGAEAMLGGGSEFAAASSAVGGAIVKLKKEVGCA